MASQTRGRRLPQAPFGCPLMCMTVIQLQCVKAPLGAGLFFWTRGIRWLSADNCLLATSKRNLHALIVLAVFDYRWDIGVIVWEPN